MAKRTFNSSIRAERAADLRHIEADELFYVVQDNYDEYIEVAIPFYRRMHDELVHISMTEEPSRILDLGAGTGKTTAVLLEKFHGSSAKLIDLFDEMLKHARARLARFGRRAEFVRGDFMTVPLGDNYDLCVSSLAIHHQNETGKRYIFERIFDALAPGGRFIMIDWTKFSSPFFQELGATTAEEHAADRVRNAAVLREWCEHWRTKNIPETVEDLCTWLKASGFAHAECVVRYYGMALICAEKGP